ncbi:MAG TPA: DUF6644 family protein [Pyrinomonadaceae bacterium]|nr:DUF6644 family protein [Pyrinomonadaceae bacterium]
MQAASADTALQTWLRWLENTGLAVTMRESAWLYPIVETVHIIGFVVVVGAAAMFDLRLLGASRGLPVTETARHLLPWSRAGLLAVVPSGLLLFMSSATALSINPAFRLKLVLLAAAAANAFMFHRWPFKTVTAWNRDVSAPTGAKISAVVSLALWASIISCGRFIAYF